MDRKQTQDLDRYLSDSDFASKQEHRAGDSTTVQELADLVAEFVEERGWKRYHQPKDIAIALSVEAAELLELWQWTGAWVGCLHNSLVDVAPQVKSSQPHIARVAEELADVVIYALSMANACGIDLAQAVLDKLEANAVKYPAPGKLEALAQAQGVQPLDVKGLARTWPGADDDGFEEAIREHRKGGKDESNET